MCYSACTCACRDSIATAESVALNRNLQTQLHYLTIVRKHVEDAVMTAGSTHFQQCVDYSFNDSQLYRSTA
jgi:hypothetical protein